MSLSVVYQDPTMSIVSITFVSSTVLTATALNKFLVVGDGVVIEDTIVQTDGTGIAGGTLFQVKHSGTGSYGAAIILSHAVSALGANVTFDMTTATTKNRTTLVGGEYITLSSTSADCTGAGVTLLTIRYRKLNSNSYIQAV